MSDRPDVPSQLLALIVGRGVFAQTWHLAGKMNAMDAVAVGLAEKGWSVSSIVAALCNHPDREVRREDAERLAREALATVPPKPVRKELEQPRIAKILCQRPRTYEVAFAGETFTVGTQAIANRNAFRVACLDNTATVPSLPGAKVFDLWLEAQLSGAEQVEQPPEASSEGMEQEFVEGVIASMHLGEEVKDIMGQRLVVDGGFRYMHAPTIWLNHVRLDMPSITSTRFTAILRKLGWLPHDYQGEHFRSRTWRQAWDGLSAVPWASKMAKEREATAQRESAAVQKQYAQVDKGMFDE